MQNYQIELKLGKKVLGNYNIKASNEEEAKEWARKQEKQLTGKRGEALVKVS